MGAGVREAPRGTRKDTGVVPPLGHLLPGERRPTHLRPHAGLHSSGRWSLGNKSTVRTIFLVLEREASSRLRTVWSEARSEGPAWAGDGSGLETASVQLIGPQREESAYKTRLAGRPRAGRPRVQGGGRPLRPREGLRGVALSRGPHPVPHCCQWRLHPAEVQDFGQGGPFGSRPPSRGWGAGRHRSPHPPWPALGGAGGLGQN